MHEILAHVEAEESENVNGYWEECKDSCWCCLLMKSLARNNT